MRPHVVLASCNPTCDDAPVPTPEYDPEIEAAALEEIDRLTAEFRAANAALEEKRAALREAIVRHLRERNARPGDIAEHSPYDRNHVRRLGVEEGVPALRELKPATRRPRKKAS
jgi:hypothetical protein